MGTPLVETAVEIILILVTVGCVLAFGGVQPITYSIAEISLYFAALLLLLKRLPEGRRRQKLPIWLQFFIGLVVLQLTPLPMGVINLISPRCRLDFGAAGAAPAWVTASIYPHQTAQGLAKFIAYVIAFYLVVHLLDARKGKIRILKVLVFLGCFEAGLGIYQYLTKSNKIFTYTNRFSAGEATGTYINRNHYAGLLELTLPFVVAFIFNSFQVWAEGLKPESQRFRSAETRSAGSLAVFYIVILLFMLVAIVLSTSRAGTLAALASLVFVALLAQLKVMRRSWGAGVVIFLVAVTSYGLWIGLDPVLARFESLRQAHYVQAEGRLNFWIDSVGLIRDYPVAGTGLGTFGIAFRRFQTERVNNYVDHAHNDYVEITAETGLVGAALLVLPIFYLFVRMVASFFSDARRLRRAVTLGCIGSTLALLLHSLTDFNLQMPANALIFAVVQGVGYKIVCVERREEKESRALTVGAGESEAGAGPKV